MRSPHPMQLAPVLVPCDAAGETVPLAHGTASQSCITELSSVECFEHQPHRSLYLGVRIENQNAVIPIDEADWRWYLKLAPPRLVITPPLILAFKKYNSASDIVPFRPSRSLSLKHDGS